MLNVWFLYTSSFSMLIESRWKKSDLKQLCCNSFFFFIHHLLIYLNITNLLKFGINT